MSKQPLPQMPRWDGPLSHPFYSHVVKRIIDFLFALILLIPGCIIMLPLAIWVKLDSPGPVLYKAVRGGYHNQPFYIYKFRAMVVGADKTGGCTALNDSRVTRAGKVMRRLKLDELPQLFNILKGDMSMVGPRPERKVIADQYAEEIPEFVLRTKVKAGLTGYAQVYGKYNTTPYDKLKFDITYIENYSLWLDVKIMLLTFKILFQKENTEGVDEAQQTALKDQESDTGIKR